MSPYSQNGNYLKNLPAVNIFEILWKDIGKVTQNDVKAMVGKNSKQISSLKGFRRELKNQF